KLNIVFVVGVRRVIIAQYYEILKMFCGLSPVAFEPESLSLLRNLPPKWDAKQSVALVYTKENSASWFLLWNGFIFDSSTTSFTEGKGIEEALANDLKKSELLFEKNTALKITQVIVTGKSELMPSIEKALKEKIPVPITVMQESMVPLQGLNIGNAEAFSSACGAALKGIGLEGAVPIAINLIKKE
ncbi:MAG: hypothetical protein V1760_01895, partial [Candidatus Peregrinibacteria bacterium]